MQAAVAVSYFHRKIGPMVYYSYPEESLKNDEKARLADIMDQAFEEGFFTHRFGDLTSLNYYFEIESDWARGKKEMLMVSLIIDANPNDKVEEIIKKWTKAFADRLKSTDNMYKAFYSYNDSQVSEDDFDEIKNYGRDLRFWVKELYWTAIEQLRERTEEEKWAQIMSEPAIFKVIKKLSKGPVALEDFTKWFNTVFPEKDLNKILHPLEQEKFIFINTIGQDTYILLVKDVSIMRVPPNCIIDLEEDSPELADLTEIYINEVTDFFDTYTPSPLDSLELFKLFADPKIYNVISQLREGPLPKMKILSMVSEEAQRELLKNLELLQEKSIIQEFSYMDEKIFILKTDVILTASFPEYLKKILPKESKGQVAKSLHTKYLLNEELHADSNLDESNIEYEMTNKSNLQNESIKYESKNITEYDLSIKTENNNESITENKIEHKIEYKNEIRMPIQNINENNEKKDISNTIPNKITTLNNKQENSKLFTTTNKNIVGIYGHGQKTLQSSLSEVNLKKEQTRNENDKHDKDIKNKTGGLLYTIALEADTKDEQDPEQRRKIQEQLRALLE